MTVDRKIIEDCIAGKRRAQNKLYHMFAGIMLGICIRYTNNRTEAEDILQEGFIKVFKNINSLKEYGSIEGWIRRIMVNTAITHVKKNKIFFDELIESEITEMEQEKESYSPVDPETLIMAIHQLPNGYRMVLNLYVFEDYSHKEIADTLNISESTSKSQLFKARRSIKNSLEKLGLVNKYTVEHENKI